MKLSLSATHTIDTQFIEGLTREDGAYIVEMASGSRHEVSSALYQTLMSLIGTDRFHAEARP